MTAGQPCPFGDLYCPCQDGLACHYVDLPDSPAMTPPTPEEIEVIRLHFMRVRIRATISQRALERGRRLTASEQLANLAKALKP